MQLSKETRRAYLALLACVALGATIRYVAHYITASVVTGPFSFCCHVVGPMLWMRLLRQRFVRREVLLLFSLIAAFLLLFLCVQTLKYEFVPNGNALSRLCWYAFYVPITFVPTLLFFSTLYIGRRQDEAPDWRWSLLIVVPAAISVLVLTNDLHQLAFNFGVKLEPGVLVNDGSGYSHGAAYYAVWAWVVIMGVSSLLVARAATSRAHLGTKALMPVAVIALMVGILPLYGPARYIVSLESTFKFPDMTCILMVAFMESMVLAGFFPCNEGYEAIWRASSLRGGFVNHNGDLADVSSGSPVVTAAQVVRALEHPALLENGHDLLVAHRVVGGTAYWVRDLSTVHELRRRLEDLGDALAQERSLLSAENELARSQEALVQRQDLYGRVVENTAGQLSALEGMLSSMPADDEAFLAQMRQAAVLATYIKRCANMTLLGEGGFVDVRELSLALEESAECLRSLGVAVNLQSEVAGMVKAEDALSAYAAFEGVVEESLAQLSRVSIILCRIGEALELRCDLAADEPRAARARLTLAGGLS